MSENIHDWPYPDIEERLERRDYSWREVDEKIYWDQLECVPPARMTQNAFMVGECYTFNENGNIHAAFCVVKDRYFCRLAPIALFNPEQYTSEIRKQFGL